MKKNTTFVLILLVACALVALQAPSNGSAATGDWENLGDWQPNVLSMIYDAANNKLWCGTSNQGGVTYDFDARDWVDLSEGTPLQDKWVPSIVLGKGGTPYAATDNGVYSHSGSNWVLDGLQAEKVTCLAYDSKGHVLYAGTDDGVWKNDLDSPQWLSTNGPRHNGNDEYVWCLLWDAAAGDLYAGTSVTGYGGAWSMAGGWSSLAGLEGTSVLSLSMKDSLYAGVSSAGNPGKDMWGVWRFNGGWNDTGLAAERADAVTSMAWMGNTLCAGTMDYGIWYKNGGWTQDEDMKSDTNCLLYMQNSPDVLFCGSVNGVVYNGTLPAPSGSNFYMAEGYTGSGFQTYLCVGNPNDDPAEVDITYTYPSGQPDTEQVTVDSNGRKTINVNDKAGPGQEVSISVQSDSDNLVAERPVYFDYGDKWPGGHDVVGATAPDTNWYFAEGSTLSGFEEYITVQNTGAVDAYLTFNYMVEGEGEQVFTGTVFANSRATFTASAHVGFDKNVSLFLESSEPVVAERPFYFDYQGLGSHGWTGGHCVVGANSPQKTWYMAEGTTRPGFEEWLCLQNPNDRAITVDATYLLGPGQGGPVEMQYDVDAKERLTVSVNKELGTGYDVSVELDSTYGFIAERPLYFNYNGSWPGGHDVLGANQSARTWFFAEGYTGFNFQEYLCIQNPNDQSADVTITYYPEGGGTPIIRDHTVGANTRETVNVNDDAGPELSISAKVTSDVSVIVERPMYFNYNGAWPGGHDVVGHVPR